MIKRIISSIFFICLIFNLFAQKQVESITFRYGCRSKAIAEVLKDFERQTQYRFTYNSAIFEKKAPITIVEKNYTFEQLLNITLGEQFTYKIIGNQILISEVQSATVKETPLTPSQQLKRPQVAEKPAFVEIIYDTIRVYDTITVVKTERKTIIDTQKVLMPTHSQKKYMPQSTLDWSIFTGVASILPVTTMSSVPGYKKQLQNSEQPCLTNSLTFMALYRTQALLAGVGVGYADVGYESNFRAQSYTNDPGVTYADTLWYWKYSKLFTYYKYFNNDSIAIDVYDSTYTYQIVENPKKVEHNTQVASKLSIHYVTVPFMVGYRFLFDKSWSFEPFFLASLQILTRRSGSIPAPYAQQQLWIKNVPFKSVTYTLGAGCLLNYAVSPHILISLKGAVSFYPSIYKSSYKIAQKALLSGSVEWGVAYRIPYELF